MLKEEVIAEIEIHETALENLKVWFELIRPEERYEPIFEHGILTYLITGVDYLQVNLIEMKNRVRMS